MPHDPSAVVVGADGVPRCWWAGADPLYTAYHDDEWGRPVHDEVRLYEKLCLEGFQAGLSWITILRKRPAFREVFAGFDPTIVAGYGEADVARLLGDARIIRHRGKIEATIGNAAALLAMHERGERLVELVWSHAEDAATAPARPVSPADVRATSAASVALSKQLKRLGWRFVGPTTVYAFLQSMGVVDDHVVGCHAATA